jgi:predicted lipoprotein with Yx(FWY)xxD motif
VRASDYGRILFDDRGYALYAFTRDARGRSACAEACPESWPPYLLRGSLRAGTALEPSLLATIRRPNGDRQVTYAGRPLYHWIGDRKPGAVGCQNVSEFGGLWLVVRADGRLVRERESAGALSAEQVPNLVPELVPVSAHLTAPRGTEAGSKPRFSPQMDLS